MIFTIQFKIRSKNKLTYLHLEVEPICFGEIEAHFTDVQITFSKKVQRNCVCSNNKNSNQNTFSYRKEHDVVDVVLKKKSARGLNTFKTSTKLTCITRE
jgi:hypothetical protein